MQQQDLNQDQTQAEHRREHRLRRKRARRDTRFKFYCIAALLVAFAFLAFFLFNLISKGASAFREARIHTTVRYTERSLEQPFLAVPEDVRPFVSREPLRLMPQQLQAHPRAEIKLYLDIQNGDPADPLAAIQAPPGVKHVTADHISQLIGPDGIQEIKAELRGEHEAQTEADFPTPGERWVWANHAADQYVKAQQKHNDTTKGSTTTGSQHVALDETAIHTLDRLLQAKLARRKYDERFGTTEQRWLLADSDVDQFLKGHTNQIDTVADRFVESVHQAGYEPSADIPYDKVVTALKEQGLYANKYQLKDQAKAWQQRKTLREMQQRGDLKFFFNANFFTGSDSQLPEAAGIWPAIIGSVLVLGLVFVLSFPIGVLTAIYLEEFAPDNKLTQFIEVNINNLAAVPSILFGLLGLAAFINLPQRMFDINLRSTALVGGLTLSLMTLPVIIISARAALRAVPSSIRLGAMGMGATRWQAICHHVLPQSISGMLTGAIIGLAQAMGETAPLIMIGLVGFITSPAKGVTDPTTVMPAQIYHWYNNSQPAFEELAAAGILVLLAVLISMNTLAVLLRAKFEKRW